MVKGAATYSELRDFLCYWLRTDYEKIGSVGKDAA